ncbi:hypothetical protein GOY17_04590 [Lysobacter soli]|uniref:hypothetical protein n=1 Tax=Lysobacter soli TaxID=453783 RepID=UPI0012EDF4A8|nr:hypothetical protein [Lysobacter soli]QGW64253.1 hypothetical protein GOY17_04590 [Lysobacter soli]
MRRLLTALLVSSLLALAACAPHSENAIAATPASDAAQAAAPQPTRARAPEPAPKERQAEPAGTPIKLDFSCKTDADCAVKNVGNCCGAKPACVNANSPTDPEGVKAECARKGMMAMCGFKAIEGCTCEQGQCKDKIAEVEAVH